MTETTAIGSHELPLEDAEGVAVSRSRPSSLSKVQFVMICFAFASNLVFVPIVSDYLAAGQWGVKGTSQVIPNKTQHVFGIPISTNAIIIIHASAAMLLAVSFAIQMILIHRRNRTPRATAAHRTVGIATMCVTAPLFLLVATVVCFTVIQTPFNRALYLVLPVMIAFALVAGMIGHRAGDKIRHADSMFLAIILLEAAPVFRIVDFLLIKAGQTVIASNGETADSGVILRTVIVLAILTVGYQSAGRLRRNVLPLAVISSVLVGSLIFLPWAWAGAPA